MLKRKFTESGSPSITQFSKFQKPIETTIDQFTGLGCDRKLIEKVFEDVQNRTNLFEVYRRIPLVFRQKMVEPWQFLLLSGEEEATQVVLKQLKDDPNLKSPTNESPLFYAALSGDDATFDSVLNFYGKDLHTALSASANNGYNLIHYATLSRSVEMFDKIVALYRDNGVNIQPVAENDRNVLHIASSVNWEMTKAVLKAMKNGEINLSEDAVDKDGFNATNYAVGFDNHMVKNKLIKNLSLVPTGDQEKFYFHERELPSVDYKRGFTA